jgi:hypothetical protein
VTGPPSLASADRPTLPATAPREPAPRPGAWRLLAKAALLSAPLGVLLIIYGIADPFAVLRRPTAFYPEGSVLPRNRDYVSTETLLAQGPVRHYDAFILGSSRSLPYLTADWARHLDPAIRPFHYDASLESLFGVWAKARLLDDHGYQLREVLIVADRNLLSRPDHDDQRPLFRKHPEVSRDGWFAFETSFIQAFLLRGFFVAYLDHRLFGRWRGYMNGLLQHPDDNFRQLPETNDSGAVAVREARIAREGERYFQEFAPAIATDQPGVPTPPSLGRRSLERIGDLAALFARHRCRVRLIISPLTDRRPLAAADRDNLERLLGRDSVWDFSGDNEVTRDVHNYYDPEHYRTGIARRIMDRAYGGGDPAWPRAN